MAEKLQTISEIRHQLITMFSVTGSVREAGAMATQILREYTGMEGASQLAYGDRTVSGDDTALIMAAARRAASGEPLQYIFGYTLFCGHRIGVGPGVLIPRPETEEMTSEVITGNNSFDGIALDLCTGSGCIAIALASAFPGAKLYAADFS